jgi:hypothetical protein
MSLALRSSRSTSTIVDRRNHIPVDTYLHLLASRSDRLLSSFVDQIPRSPSYPFTVTDLAWTWLTDHYSFNPFIELQFEPMVSAYKYKKVANKIRPVATTLPEKFRIDRRKHPDPFADMEPLPTHPPEFTPNSRVTQERMDALKIDKTNFLLPEEVKLVKWLWTYHQEAFAWTDDERGKFSEEFFDPIVIPVISHVPWVMKQGPVPPGILDEVV